MSKEFKGKKWSFTVDEKGHIIPNKRFWFDMAYMFAGYIGSTSLVWAFSGALMYKPKKWLVWCMGVPVSGLSLELMSHVAKVTMPHLENDIKIGEQAVDYAKKIRNAVSDDEVEEANEEGGPKKSGRYPWHDISKDDIKNLKDLNDLINEATEKLKKDLENHKREE